MEDESTVIEPKYTEFIQKVAASKQVWGLMSKSGWANSHSADDEAVTVVPFWSDRGLAKASARDDWKSFVPTEIALADFLENWCTGMAEDETLVGINWDPRMLGTEKDALEVALHILDRLQIIGSAIKFVNYSSIDEFIEDISEEDE